MQTIPSMASSAVKVARRYEFTTFSVGVSLPDGVQEREDELRADLKLKGSETVRTQAARLVAEGFQSKLPRKVDKQRPDLMLLADFEGGEVTATSRPVFYTGRYAKPPGVAQRRELCSACGGGGCKRCRRTGTEPGPSVEALLRRKFLEFTGSDRLTFTWLGSEDRESRVYSPGRPFVAEVKNPLRRKVPGRFAARFRGGQVAVTLGRVLAAKPIKLPSFRIRTEIVGKAAAKVGPDGLADLSRAFRKATVRFDRPHDRPTSKNVYRASGKARGKTLWLDVELDGGLPVKRFVSGDLVSPSVSEVLKTEVRCRQFDICEVKVKGRFEFAEIPRVTKKN